MSAEVQESGKKRKRIQAKENDCPRRFYTYGGYEYVADYFFYAVYHVEQTSDDGNKYAEQ